MDSAIVMPSFFYKIHVTCFIQKRLSCVRKTSPERIKYRKRHIYPWRIGRQGSLCRKKSVACFWISQTTLIHTELLLTQYGSGAFETFSTRPRVWSHFSGPWNDTYCPAYTYRWNKLFFTKINHQNHWDITPCSYSAQYKCASFYRNKKSHGLRPRKNSML